MDPRERKTVLLVEDDEGVVLLLSEVLESSGYRVMSFFNPVQALEQIRRRKPDLIILDWYLPFMTGRDFLAHLALGGTRIPVLVLTGDVNLRPGPGIDAILVKPTGLDELLEEVSLLLGQTAADDGHLLEAAHA
jgi:two-component system response regulator MprA